MIDFEHETKRGHFRKRKLCKQNRKSTTDVGLFKEHCGLSVRSRNEQWEFLRKRMGDKPENVDGR